MNEFREKIGLHKVVYNFWPAHEDKPESHVSIELQMKPCGIFIEHAPTLGAARNKARTMINKWTEWYKENT